MTAYTNSITTANRIAGLIRQYSKAKIVVGGAHASALPVETLERFKNFDYLICGEGERSFTELVKGRDIADIKGLLWREGGAVIQNPPIEPIDDLDSLPFPARHLVDVSKYIPIPSNYYQLPSTGILSSRGCPYQCTYCGRSGSRFKNRIKFRSIENIIEEIKSAGSWEDICNWEIETIKLLKTKTPDGYNLSDGGSGPIGLVRTQEDKNKISTAKVEYYKDPEKRKETRWRRS